MNTSNEKPKPSEAVTEVRQEGVESAESGEEMVAIQERERAELLDMLADVVRDLDTIDESAHSSAFDSFSLSNLYRQIVYLIGQLKRGEMKRSEFASFQKTLDEVDDRFQEVIQLLKERRVLNEVTDKWHIPEKTIDTEDQGTETVASEQGQKPKGGGQSVEEETMMEAALKEAMKSTEDVPESQPDTEEVHQEPKPEEALPPTSRKEEIPGGSGAVVQRIRDSVKELDVEAYVEKPWQRLQKEFLVEQTDAATEQVPRNSEKPSQDKEDQTPEDMSSNTENPDALLEEITSMEERLNDALEGVEKEKIELRLRNFLIQVKLLREAREGGINWKRREWFNKTLGFVRSHFDATLARVESLKRPAAEVGAEDVKEPAEQPESPKTEKKESDQQKEWRDAKSAELTITQDYLTGLTWEMSEEERNQIEGLKTLLNDITALLARLESNDIFKEDEIERIDKTLQEITEKYNFVIDELRKIRDASINKKYEEAEASVPDLKVVLDTRERLSQAQFDDRLQREFDRKTEGFLYKEPGLFFGKTKTWRDVSNELIWPYFDPASATGLERDGDPSQMYVYKWLHNMRPSHTPHRAFMDMTFEEYVRAAIKAKLEREYSIDSEEESGTASGEDASQTTEAQESASEQQNNQEQPESSSGQSGADAEEENEIAKEKPKRKGWWIGGGMQEEGTDVKERISRRTFEEEVRARLNRLLNPYHDMPGFLSPEGSPRGELTDTDNWKEIRKMTIKAFIEGGRGSIWVQDLKSELVKRKEQGGIPDETVTVEEYLVGPIRTELEEKFTIEEET